jgi:choline dehydrogenase-like flavoprotein
MGRVDDPMAVGDEDTRVIGIDGLRVVDSSIMPSITTGKLNAPTIMIGEKASDLPGPQTHPEIMQCTADFHHQVTDAPLPQPNPIFDDATVLDTTIDMLNPKTAVMQ